jgi:hypothetical protein
MLVFQIATKATSPKAVGWTLLSVRDSASRPRVTRPTLSRFAMGSEIGCVKNFCGENRQSSAIDFIYSVFGL